MKQVLRRVLDGKGVVRVEELPAPLFGDNQALIKSHYTAISAGTEGATLSKTFPELVKQTLQDPWMRNAVKNLVLGASPTAVKNIVWDETTLMRAIGYSGSGTVVSVGKNTPDIKEGDRVAFAAEGHAEFVAPGYNFIIPIPENVTFQQASLVTLGGIAMQGIRRADIQLGENITVIGLGLVGQLVAQLAHNCGAHVIGVDINPTRLNELKNILPNAQTVNSADGDTIQAVLELTGGHGADTVIICAASKDAAIANQAMKMARKQGKVVFVGLVKMDLERMPFFRNELDLRFSRAYGPGVMDPEYESSRVDYPFHYVRWTQQRNLSEFLRLIGEKRLHVDHLIGGCFELEKAQTAYDELYNGKLNGPVALLKYHQEANAASQSYQPARSKTSTESSNNPKRINLGVIGCGNFTRSTHIPNLHKHPDIDISAIASTSGVNAVSILKRFNIGYSTTDYQSILADPNISSILIATRHNTHAQLSIEALKAGKHVFVEKPAVLTETEYEALNTTLQSTDRIYTVGYNRRYAPLAIKLKQLLNPELPMIIQYQVCIPDIPADHWTINPTEGGGRLIGEAEHFFDFTNFLVGDSAKRVTAQCITKESESVNTQFNFMVSIDYGERANASVNYTSYGDMNQPRESVTVFQAGTTYTLTEFKKLYIQGQKRKKIALPFSNMGHEEELKQFTNAILGHTSSLDLTNPLAASRISLDALHDLTTKHKSEKS